MEKFKIKYIEEDLYNIFILREDWYFLSETSSEEQSIDFIERYCKRNKIENKIIF